MESTERDEGRWFSCPVSVDNASPHEVLLLVEEILCKRLVRRNMNICSATKPTTVIRWMNDRQNKAIS